MERVQKRLIIKMKEKKAKERAERKMLRQPGTISSNSSENESEMEIPPPQLTTLPEFPKFKTQHRYHDKMKQYLYDKVEQYENSVLRVMTEAEINEVVNELSLQVNKGPVNHVRRNIELQRKSGVISQIQLFYRQIIREKNTAEIKHFKGEVDLVQRALSMQSLNKWEDFRDRRLKAIDDYCEVSKAKLKVRIHITSIVLNKLVIYMKTNFDHHRKIKMIEMAKRHVQQALEKIWLVKLEERGQIFNIFRNYCRNSFTFKARFYHSIDYAPFQLNKIVRRFLVVYDQQC